MLYIGTMNKKEIKTQKSRERIINCAIEIFGDKGYDSFTVTALCKTYRISKGLFYHNFSGKDELFLKCVEITYKKLIAYLNIESALPTIEQYVELRLRFFRENPLLSRIFFESLIRATSSLFDEVGKIRNTLLEFNRLVYSNFLSTAKLRQGVTKEDAMEYFEMIQKMLNSYYSSPSFRKEDIIFLENEHRKNLSKFLEYIILGILDKT